MKNIVNALSLSRIFLGLLFLIVVLFFNANSLAILLIFVLAFLTDRFDGKLARNHNLDSQKGARIDVLCDFSFIMLTF